MFIIRTLYFLIGCIGDTCDLLAQFLLDKDLNYIVSWYIQRWLI